MGSTKKKGGKDDGKRKTGYGTKIAKGVTILKEKQGGYFTKCSIAILMMSIVAVGLITCGAVPVHNPILAVFLLMCSVISAILIWNICWGPKGVTQFVNCYPTTDLTTANCGQYVKVTGVVTCAKVSLESSFQRVPRCIYTSTSLYEYGRLTWRLRLIERHVVDFYICDSRSGMRVLVKTGYGAEVTPYVYESDALDRNMEGKDTSPEFLVWLLERNISSGRIMRLKEGYIKEGSIVSVMGTFKRNGDELIIISPSEPVSTGCQWGRCILPTYLCGLLLILKGTSNVDTDPRTGKERHHIGEGRLGEVKNCISNEGDNSTCEVSSNMDSSGKDSLDSKNKMKKKTSIKSESENEGSPLLGKPRVMQLQEYLKLTSTDPTTRIRQIQLDVFLDVIEATELGMAIASELLFYMIGYHKNGETWNGKFNFEDLVIYDDHIIISKQTSSAYEHRPFMKDFKRLASMFARLFNIDKKKKQPLYYTSFVRSLRNFIPHKRFCYDLVTRFHTYMTAHPFLQPSLIRMSLFQSLYVGHQCLDTEERKELADFWQSIYFLCDWRTIALKNVVLKKIYGYKQENEGKDKHSKGTKIENDRVMNQVDSSEQKRIIANYRKGPRGFTIFARHVFVHGPEALKDIRGYRIELLSDIELIVGYELEDCLVGIVQAIVYWPKHLKSFFKMVKEMWRTYDYLALRGMREFHGRHQLTRLHTEKQYAPPGNKICF